MNEIYKNYVENIKDLNSLITVINNYFQGILKKEKYMSCPFHNDKSPSFYITDKGQGAFYKCFSCGESGDILSFIQKIENLNFIDSLKKAYEILQIPIELPKIKNNEINRVNKNKSVQYYNEQSQKSINENNIDKAFELSCKAENENEKSYFVNLPYLDSKGRPLKIWENLNEILKFNNIKVQYNEVSKITEIKGVDSTEFNNQIMDIHSLSIKCGLNLNLSLLLNFINRIGEENCVNPVCDYLDNCYKNFDNEKVYIQKLCDAIIIDNEFDKTIKEMLIIKWLINTAKIPYNDGNYNIEGILTLQGKQGIGKTRFINKLGQGMLKYIKTGIDLDPSDKDKINQCTKYWIVELGELDATLKKDLAKLKAFITEGVDEYRMPYALTPIRYPRKTSFYATVNNKEFLKDETGNRRYWVIPVEKIDFEIIDSIDMDKLWGEVMHLLENECEVHYLRKEELELLNKSNEEFKALGTLEIAVNNEFNWKIGREFWAWKSSHEIAGRLKLKSTKGLKEALEVNGGVFKRQSNCRGYLVPPFMGPPMEFECI